METLLEFLKWFGIWYGTGLALFTLVAAASWAIEDEIITAKDIIMMLLVSGLGPLILIAPVLDKLAEKVDFTVITNRSGMQKYIKETIIRLLVIFSKAYPRGKAKSALFNETHGRWRVKRHDGSVSQLMCYDAALEDLAESTAKGKAVLFYTKFTEEKDKRTADVFDTSGRPLKANEDDSDAGVDVMHGSYASSRKP